MRASAGMGMAVDMPLRLSNAARCSHIHSHRTKQFVYLCILAAGWSRLRSKIGFVGTCRGIDVDLLADTFRPEQLDQSNVVVCPDQRAEIVEQLDDGERFALRSSRLGCRTGL